MYFEYKEAELNALLRLTDNVGLVTEDANIKKGLIHLLWNRSNVEACFYVDDLPVKLKPNQITAITYVHFVTFVHPLPQLTIVSFNREFYCIKDHDHEVSCNGILFMGTSEIPIIDLNPNDKKSLEALLDVFKDEFATKDNIQGEMLQMLLKRLIIKCTRLVREQSYGEPMINPSIEAIRKFNVLVDAHFKEYKLVADYADMMYRSPKTLANLFKQYGSKSPLQLIHERIVIEARRMLIKTDKTAKEIAYDLGFDQVSPFNKMFKRIVGQSPIEFRSYAREKEKSTITQE